MAEFSGSEFKKPKKWAHFAGDLKTFGYSEASIPMIFMSWTIMFTFELQWGQA